MDRNQICAYAAGIIDGEGCIGVYNTRTKTDTRAAYFQITVRVCMKDHGAISFLNEHFDGALSFQRYGKGGKGGPYPLWQARNRKAEAFLREILPWLVVKKDQAELVLEFAIHRRKTRESMPHNERYPDSVIVDYQGYVDRLKAMK